MSLWAVAALGESDAWAVGRHMPLPEGTYPLTEHWDGKRWSAVPCPSPGSAAEPTRSSLTAVAIDAPHDAWAVGSWSPIEHDAPSYALIEHWNGSRWNLVPVPRSHGFTGLTAVAAISPNAAWAIGYGDAGGRAITAFMGWDGTRWRSLPSPVGTDLTGLAVISAHDIWVVGSKGMSKYRAVAEHWDGSKWTIVPTPNAFKNRTRNSVLYAVSGSASNNVWAVGWYQSGPTGSDHSTLVEHWDGARWQVQPSPDGPRSGADSQLFAVAALSRTTAWAAGTNEGPIPLIERWNGVHWKAIPRRLQPRVAHPSIYEVAVVDPRYAWAIVQVDQGSVIERWNGTRWQDSYRARAARP